MSQEASIVPDSIVEKKRPESPVYDVMDGSSRWEVKIHDHGLVALLDVMPRFAPVGKTADFAIVQAARVSYGEGTKQVNEDRGLIRYLARHRHSTPFEMVEFKFHHVMPIFVARQWIPPPDSECQRVFGTLLGGQGPLLPPFHGEYPPAEYDEPPGWGPNR